MNTLYTLIFGGPSGHVAVGNVEKASIILISANVYQSLLSFWSLDMVVAISSEQPGKDS